jgi:hypothetical protein
MTQLMGWRRRGGHPLQPTPGTGLLAAVWGIYLGGAAAAAVATRLSHVLVFVFPLALLLLVIVVAAVTFRQR